MIGRSKYARDKEEIERCKLERQGLLTTIRKEWATEAEAEMQFKVIKEEQEYWEQEVVKLGALEVNTDTLWDSFWPQFKEIERMFNWGFNPTPEQKKEILNLLLEGFILYNNGKIELRFKLQMNERQIAETVATLSHNNLA